jgi:4-amino-4-deoxy-L-arabinose transferase-like glycosyltransferase
MSAERTDPDLKRSYLLFGAVAALAVAFRIAYLLIALDKNLFPGIFLDARYYAELARGIALGDDAGTAPYLMSPLYPYFLALFTGSDGHLAVWGVRAVQMALGCLGAVFVSAIARRYAGGVAGWIAGVAYALYGPLIHYEAMVLVESLQVFCVVSTLWLIANVLPTARQGMPRHIGALAVGVMFGIASGLRPTALVILAATVVVVILTGRKSAAPLRPVVTAALTMIAGAILCIVPFTIRNIAASGEPVLLSANGGFNFWIGNRAGSSGIFITPPGYDFEHDPVGLDLARKEAGRPLSYREASSWWTDRAIADIRTDPVRWAGLILKKFRLFLGQEETPQLGDDFSWYRERAWPLQLPVTATMVLVPALLVPLCLRAFRRGGLKRLALPYAWMLSYGLAVSLFFFTGRYRAPIMPVAFVLAAVALSLMIEQFRGGKFRGRAAALVIAAIAAIALLSTPAGTVTAGAGGTSPTGLIERQNGLAMYEQGKFPEAEQWYRKSLAIREDPITLGNLANALKAQGRFGDAEAEYRRVLEMDPRAAVTWYNLGNLYRDYRKDRSGAADCYLRAIDCQPQFPNPYLTLALVYSYDGKFDQALRIIDRGLERIPGTETGIRGRLAELKEGFKASKAAPGR